MLCGVAKKKLSFLKINKFCYVKKKKENLWQGERKRKRKKKKTPPDAVKTQMTSQKKILATHPTKNYSPSCKKSS